MNVLYLYLPFIWQIKIIIINLHNFQLFKLQKRNSKFSQLMEEKLQLSGYRVVSVVLNLLYTYFLFTLMLFIPLLLTYYVMVFFYKRFRCEVLPVRCPSCIMTKSSASFFYIHYFGGGIWGGARNWQLWSGQESQSYPKTLSGTPPPVLPTSHRIWTNPTIGPWEKWGDASPQSPRGYATDEFFQRFNPEHPWIHLNFNTILYTLCANFRQGRPFTITFKFSTR